VIDSHGKNLRVEDNQGFLALVGPVMPGLLLSSDEEGSNMRVYWNFFPTFPAGFSRGWRMAAQIGDRIGLFPEILAAEPKGRREVPLTEFGAGYGGGREEILPAPEKRS